ncbi:MAG: phage minor capsid protein, partial [Sphaerochaetaceae bacterium]
MDPYNIREIFQAMEYDLIKSLKRNFEKHAMDEIDEGFKWEMWQLAKLREMEKFRKRNREIIGQYSPDVERIIQETLTEYYIKGEKKVISDVKKMDELTLALLFPRGINIEDSFSPENIFFGMNDKKLEALIKTVKDDIKNPQHAVLRKMDDVYRQTIYRAEMSMATGAKTLGQAIDMATEDFRKQGLNVVQYSNGSMHTLATYAEMALRTASQRATFMGEGKKRDQFGVHLVVVSAHASTCDDCLP